MKRKIILEYDDATGAIYTSKGVRIGSWVGLTELQAPSKSASNVLIDDLAKLKEAGFEADDIILLKKKGLI